MMTFNEEKHTYLADTGELYLSATAFIKKFCKPFDKYKIGKKFAKTHKRNLEDVLEEWEKSGRDAIEKGTAYHKQKEQELLSSLDISVEDELHPVHPGIYHEGNKISTSLKLEPGVYPELIVWSDRYKIAGQADYVEITKRGKINIKDYKTSKEIKMVGYENWDGQTQKMKFPFNHLDDCNYYQYALQLNLYAYLIKSHNRNLEIGKLILEHVNGDFTDNKTFQINNIVQYEVPNLQDDIKVGLEYYINQMSFKN